ncbi:hypothetical protein HDV62DRAFT_402619 [Trichoderma sp. SZMC 28011]
MVYPGGIDLDFITITNTPAEGRESRRKYVHRRVMHNYHKRRRMRRCSNDACFAKTSPPIGARVRQASAGQDEESIHPVAPVIWSMQGSSFGPVCLLVPKIWVTPGNIRISQTIMQFLRGCPRRSGQDLANVPFVHQRIGLVTDANNPLRACQSLFRKHTSTDDEALWTGVHDIQEDIYIKCATFDKWKLLAASQAMMLLVLLRLRHGSNHDAFPAADIALLYSLQRVFVLLRDRFCDRETLLSGNRAVHDWQAWIFRESLIRTATIYFLMRILVSTECGISCDGPNDWRLEEIPLPASKMAWEATNEITWEAVSRSSVAPSPVLRYGDLIGTEGYHLNSGTAHQIEAWLEGADELGFITSISSTLAT